MGDIVQSIRSGDYTLSTCDIDAYPDAAAAFYTSSITSRTVTNAHTARGVRFTRRTYNLIESEDFAEIDDDTLHVDEETIIGATPAAVVAVIRAAGLNFSASGNDWAAHPDGSTCVDYATDRREEITAHPFGYSDAVAEVITDYVDDWQRASRAL